ncbi:MAG: histone deacetylase [Candidatus Hermodarchaeota archaeon]
MTQNNKIGLVIDKDFAIKNVPPYPYPTFLSYETPLRIKSILSYLEKKAIFKNEKIIEIKPIAVEEDIIHLAHTDYHINSIKTLSSRGIGLLGEEVYVTEDTFELAKKALGGAITSITSVINHEVNQSFAFIRPPGHHALREMASGLCIFNNIANAIIYLRTILQYNKKVAIVDIDAHFGDGLVQYFYDDPSVLYFSIHEYDFVEGEIGFIDELGTGDGLGTSINFPIPLNSTDNEFLESIEILEPVLKEFKPDLIIIAAGFDMYFDDPIGNCLLTTVSYYKFTELLLKIAEDICEGKLAFILEGGYSLIGLSVCIFSVIKALLKEDYKPPLFENLDFSNNSKKIELGKIKSSLKKLLSNYWSSIG